MVIRIHRPFWGSMVKKMNNVLDNNFKQKLIEVNRFISKPLDQMEVSPEVIDMIPRDMVLKYHLFPLKIDGNFLSVVSDSESVLTDKNFIERKLNIPIQVYWADRDNILSALNRYYEISDINRAAGSSSQSSSDDGPLKSAILQMIWHAVRLKASDIHILPTKDKILIYFRINGHLEDYSDNYNKVFNTDLGTQVINIIKDLDTSEKANIVSMNMPNNGSFEKVHEGVVYDFRIATVPVGSGGDFCQKLVLRILPQKTENVRMDALGYSASDRKLIETALYNSSTGLFIMSGPTGSGKSTGLYAQMFYLYDKSNGPLNVMTIDDPIEIKVPEFSQVQVRRADMDNIDLPPQKILEAFLRCDPDLILYNEIRTKEDGNVALMASTTGHRLFTTIHASDAVRTLTRFIDLGVSKSTLLSELKLIVAQRLVAQLCPRCSRPHILTEEEKSALSDTEVTSLVADNLRERGSKTDYIGCSCNHGYIGRTVVPEIIVFDDDFKEFLLHEEGYSKIFEYLKKQGFRTMWEKGLDLVKKGEVEISELINVVGSTKNQSLTQ